MKNALMSAVLEILFPGRCLICGKSLLFQGKPFYPACPACLEELRPVENRKRCRKCSVPLISEREICTRCREREYEFSSNYSLFEYSGIMKELIYQYKFKNRKRVALVFAGLIAAEIGKKYRNLPVVPVPARKSTLRQRGWDHLEVIAGVLEKYYRIPVLRLLKRRGKVPQKGLGYRERMINIRGGIILAERMKTNISPFPGRVVLLDDIFTTGSTVNECACILHGAGIKDVQVLTLALD